MGRAVIRAAGVGLLVWACGSGTGEEGSAPAPSPGSGAEPATPSRIAEPTGDVDPELASRGEAAFSAKGCVACHYVGRGERLVGPDLEGVPSRRSWGWYVAMVSNPDSMVRNDETARSLFAEHMTPMPNQNLTDGEIRSIWEFLRRESRAARP